VGTILEVVSYAMTSSSSVIGLRSRHLVRPLMFGVAALAVAAVLAAPLTALRLHQSMEAAAYVYQRVSVALRLTSPGEMRLDAGGVPVVDYGFKQGEYIGEQVNPLAVAAAGRQHLLEYERTGDAAALDKAESCLRWLENAVVWNGDAAVWEYNFPDSYVSELPYYSALAQANILRTLIQGDDVTGQGRYRALIDGIIVSFETTIAAGGCMVPAGPDGGKWFAEVASPHRSQPPFILNGHMEVLLRLHEYWQSSGDDSARELFDAGVVALKALLPQYDAGNWSYYDLEGNWAYDYHYTHIDELRRLYDLTAEPMFAEYADRWGSYFPWNPWWARKRLAAYLLNVASVWTILAGGLLVWWLVRRRWGRA